MHRFRSLSDEAGPALADASALPDKNDAATRWRNRTLRGRVAILGEPGTAVELTRALAGAGWDAGYVPSSHHAKTALAKAAAVMARADVIYAVGTGAHRWSMQDWMLAARRKPLAIHWLGAEVAHAAKEHQRGMLSSRVSEHAVHWCDVPWLTGALRRLGIHTEYVPLPVWLSPGTPPPLPEQFTIALDLSPAVGSPIASALPQQLHLPGIEILPFALIQGQGRAISQGERDMAVIRHPNELDAFLERTTVVVRQSACDGMPPEIAAALVAGRHVIWDCPMPGAIEAHGSEAVQNALCDLLARHRSGKLGLNLTGHAHVLERFDHRRLIAAVDGRLQALLAR